MTFLVCRHPKRLLLWQRDVTTSPLKLHVIMDFRWLDWIFLGGYLPSLSINYVAMSKDRERRLPQLYYIKMEISYDWVLSQSESSCNVATPLRFSFISVFLCTRSFFEKSFNFISAVHIYDSFHISLTLISFTGTYEPIIDLLPTSVAS